MSHCSIVSALIILAVCGVSTACDDSIPTSDCVDNWSGSMAVSDDGSQMVVAAPDPSQLHLFLVNLRTKSVRRLVADSCDALPAWRRGTNQIAYLNNGILTVGNVETGVNREVSGASFPWNNLQWSQHGQSLLYGVEAINGFGGDPIITVSQIPSSGGDETTVANPARYPAASPTAARSPTSPTEPAI